MTDPAKRPLPIRKRWMSDLSGRKMLVAKYGGNWWVAWGSWQQKKFGTFDEAIRFAHDDREIGACS